MEIKKFAISVMRGEPAPDASLRTLEIFDESLRRHTGKGFDEYTPDELPHLKYGDELPAY